MSEVVETSSGRVRGDTEAGVLAFKGIPYALPPVGARRFQPPETAQPGSGVRDAVAFGAQAWQVIFPFFDPAFDADTSWDEGRSYHRSAITTPVPNSEDCLVLNVWTPSASGKRPVMVWIHGGGFTAGSGSWNWWCGQHLARQQDVVVVTLNHRLNIFGFLYAPLHGVAPNLGMQDIAVALRWVHANIAGFGGDAGNVTIFGQSGGGMKVLSPRYPPPLRARLYWLLNAPAVSGVEAEGMLIYPKVDRILRERYDISGRTISVCTVNLDAPWWAIDQEIRALMG